MITGSEVRNPDHQINSLFVDRWSPRAMSGEEIFEEELMPLLEAARWAPSAYNNQPWRILYAFRDSEQWELFFSLLVDANKVWTKNAGVLLLFASKMTLDINGKPSVTHSFDSGAAWQNLALQGWLKGFVVHGMQGFDYDRAKSYLAIPDGFRVEMMAAIGRPGLIEDLPEELQKRETPNSRKELKEFVCEGRFAWL